MANICQCQADLSSPFWQTIAYTRNQKQRDNIHPNKDLLSFLRVKIKSVKLLKIVVFVFDKPGSYGIVYKTAINIIGANGTQRSLHLYSMYRYC